MTITVRQAAELRREAREQDRARTAKVVAKQNNCADGNHTFDRPSLIPEYADMLACECGKVQAVCE